MAENKEVQIPSENNNEYHLENQQFYYIDGRRFHNNKNIVYPFPCDDLEIDRLHLQHYLFQMVWQSSFSVPIEKQLIEGGMHVLDVGTGSGIWVLEMSSRYPLTEFKGIDMHQLFPTNCSPRNSEFIQCNILEGLPFDNEAFDFIHIRFLALAFTQDQWKNIFIPEILRVCKVGGWIQFMEWDAKFINEGPNIKRFTNTIMEFCESKNIDAMISDSLEDQLLSVGNFPSIKHEHRYCPIGSWGGKLGLMALEDIVQVSIAVKSAFGNFLNISSQEYDKFIQECVKEFEVTRTYTKTHRFYVQKIS